MFWELGCAVQKIQRYCSRSWGRASVFKLDPYLVSVLAVTIYSEVLLFICLIT